MNFSTAAKDGAGAAAAQVGVDAKLKRYPPRGGKSVLACSVETWGHVHEDLDNFLGELAVLASQRQRDRPLNQTTGQTDRCAPKRWCGLSCARLEFGTSIKPEIF